MTLLSDIDVRGNGHQSRQSLDLRCVVGRDTDKTVTIGRQIGKFPRSN